MTLPILRGLDGVRRMGKSLGNYIGVGESADEQFGKTMSIPDDLMKEWFKLLTDRPTAEIETLSRCRRRRTRWSRRRPWPATSSRSTTVPTRPTAAQANFEKQFGDKKDPDNIPEVALPSGEIGLLQLLVKVGFCKSNNEARQKVTEGAVNMGPDRTKVIGSEGDGEGGRRLGGAAGEQEDCAV